MQIGMVDLDAVTDGHALDRFAKQNRKRAEYGFREYGFKHRTQCQNELTELFAELTEFAPKLSEAQWVFFSETVLSKQYSAPVSYKQKQRLSVPL